MFFFDFKAHKAESHTSQKNRTFLTTVTARILMPKKSPYFAYFAHPASKLQVDRVETTIHPAVIPSRKISLTSLSQQG